MSEVLQMSGIVDHAVIPEFALMRAATRGTTIHKCCEAIDLGDSADAGEYSAYLDAYRKFKSDYEFLPGRIESEIRGECDGLRYVGRCDRTGFIHGIEFVLDIKSSYAPSGSWPIQLSAYALGLWGDSYAAEHGRAVVHLKKTGDYTLYSYCDRGDDDIWRAALKIVHWRVRGGAKLTSSLRKRDNQNV